MLSRFKTFVAPSGPSSDRHPYVADLGDAENDAPLSIEECIDEDVLEENVKTRIVLKTGTFPPDEATRGINMSGHLCYGKRSLRDAAGEWQDIRHFDLRTMKEGEHVRLPLGPNNLKALFLALAHRYQQLGSLRSILDEMGVAPIDQSSVTILEGKERQALELIMDRDPDFWDNVIELDTTNALETKALQLQHKRRKEALEQFKEHLHSKEWSEGEWEGFFKANEWIFGFGLSYQYFNTLVNQSYLGATSVARTGADLVDYLMATLGDTRFTVLVDIKKPESRLLHPREYRTGIYHVDKEIVGGVAQLQSYCHTWQTEGSQQLRNSPDRLGAFTYEPKALLIAGNLGQLEDDDKKKSFELYRRHIQNPQILTFDELLARAEQLVAQGAKESAETSVEEIDGG
jgi:hypothetical protein